MTDSSLRQLERSYRATASADDEAAYLLRRLRVGGVDAERVRLAAYLGFSTIYLIGVDADYAIPADVEADTTYGVEVLNMPSDDKNHFHPDYFGKGYRWHDPQVEKMLEAYAEAHRTAGAAGIEIVNAGVGGKLEVFPRATYDSLFP